MGRLPLAALPGKVPGSYLIEDHRLASIPVPQLLPALVEDRGGVELQHELLLMGDVNYDQRSGADEDQTSEPASPRKRPWERSTLPQSVRGKHQFGALVETRAEVEFIAGLYKRLYQPGPDAILDFRQAAASETAFRAFAPQCMFLHLATHGFFAAPEQPSAMSFELVSQHGNARAVNSGLQRDALLGYSPGQLSGIVFAGANRTPDATVDSLDDAQQLDDGIMTADEIAFMRLDGVRLVVLSACETGLGEVAGGEGLLGIQRGFQLAGARSTVASLWKVNDAATRRLMQEFYANYLDKELSILDALRETQLWALKNPGDVPRGIRLGQNAPETRRLSPQFWAPFVLSGDWR
ncbi:MAG: CHAT domain-containing protein, partial [Planctomycetales bacterium]|nr:CHAT domain-containing protein [Planctomycetales bacterium]